METLQQFGTELVDIFNEMSPYLLLGFLFAGILKVFLPQQFIERHLSKPNFKSTFLAALIGVPMPLCSCGVIPTGVSIHKNGASKGASISFLISTPQTGVDSILATYSLLGLPFAIIRPVVALFTGIFGGVLSNKTEKAREKETDYKTDTCETSTCTISDKKQAPKIYTLFKYAFVDFLQDIAKWLIIGLILAALISVLIPDNFFEQFIGNQWLEMFVILLVAIPLYVCATGSIPIAAALMLKGLSPGAALVFLMAGPATNAATITVLRKSLGKKSTWVYLIAIISGAIFFGITINHFLPEQWFALNAIGGSHHAHGFIPEWLKWASTIVLTLLIINALYLKNRNKHKENRKAMNEKIIIVNGMNCNHCKNSVEKNVGAISGIHSVSINLAQKTAVIEGENIDMEKVKTTIKDLGFEYGGEKKVEN